MWANNWQVYRPATAPQNLSFQPHPVQQPFLRPPPPQYQQVYQQQQQQLVFHRQQQQQQQHYRARSPPIRYAQDQMDRERNPYFQQRPHTNIARPQPDGRNYGSDSQGDRWANKFRPFSNHGSRPPENYGGGTYRPKQMQPVPQRNRSPPLQRSPYRFRNDYDAYNPPRVAPSRRLPRPAPADWGREDEYDWGDEPKIPQGEYYDENSDENYARHYPPPPPPPAPLDDFEPPRFKASPNFTNFHGRSPVDYKKNSQSPPAGRAFEEIYSRHTHTQLQLGKPYSDISPTHSSPKLLSIPNGQQQPNDSPAENPTLNKIVAGRPVPPRPAWSPEFDSDGFLLAKSRRIKRDAAEESRLKNIEKERTAKWQRMLAEWEKFESEHSAVVKRRVMKGIPRVVRGRAWQALLHSKTLAAKYPGLYPNLLKNGRVADGDAEQIRKDLNRTFPTHFTYKEENGFAQQRLFNLLFAYAAYDTNVGYCQGMSFVAGILLMHIEDEEEAFWCFVRLIQGYEMWGLYTKDMPFLQMCLFSLDRLIFIQAHKLHSKLKKEEVTTMTYATQWFNSLFSCITPEDFPFETVMRIWDVFLYERGSWRFIFSSALAIILRSQSLLPTMNFEEMMGYLKRPPLNVLEPESLIRNANNIRLSRTDLEDVFGDYKVEVLGTKKAVSPPKRE